MMNKIKKTKTMQVRELRQFRRRDCEICLGAALVILLCIGALKLSDRFGFPDLILFM